LKIAVLEGSLRAVIPRDGLTVGYGTYLGMILVLLRSEPTIEQPLGTITPPSTELNL
jgi:hypothetical protein